MSVNLSLAGLFQQVFGIGGGDDFDPQFDDVVGSRPHDLKRKEAGALGSPYYGTDANGKEYYLPVTMSYVEDQETGILKYVALPYPVIGITSKKHIVSTQLTERRGTVKELISTGDYKITIKGFAISKTNEFPEDVITMLRRLYEQQVAVSIVNPVTDIFLLRPDRQGSDKVVITDFRMPEVVGVKNVRAYYLELESDELFNLEDIG